MKIKYEPKFNFHQSPAIDLVITGKKAENFQDEEVFTISKGQARKIANHFCGMSECRCPKGEVDEIEYERYDDKACAWGILVANCEVV